MKNIYKNITSLLLTSLLLFTSCDTNLDINKDPDLLNPDQVPMSAELPAAETGIAAAKGSYLAIIGGFWSQYWTQSAVANQYRYIDDYSLNSTSQINNSGAWTPMYDALTDVKNVKAKAKAENNWNYYLIATTLDVYASQILTDMYGSVPYSEANTPSILNPKFDTPDFIYDQMVIDLKDALSKNFAESPIENTPGNSDFIFGGDMNKWKEFANTLLLKVYLRQSNVRPSVAQQGITTLINSGAAFLNSDAAITQFVDEDSRSNPLYESDRRQLNVGTNLRASETLGGYLSNNSDTRAAKYYDGTNYQLQGNYFNGSATASVVTLSPTDPVYFISLAESKFLQAEASVRYMGGTNAQSLYEEGVNAAFDRWGLDASSFISGVYAYPNGTDEENIKAIITQKWIDGFPANGYESFIEHNRTGYPKVSSLAQNDPSYVAGEFAYPIEGKTNGAFPKRLEYPQTELQRNSNAPSTIVDILVPVWYVGN